MQNEIISGPILRKVDSRQFVLWWVSSAPCEGEFVCYRDDECLAKLALNAEQVTRYAIGERAVVHLLNLSHDWPEQTLLEYDLLLRQGEQLQGLHAQMPQLCYAPKKRPSFFIAQRIQQLLHGSCRNPQALCEDSLLAGDTQLAQTLTDLEARPALLMLSGDQIYADHVAGPMLSAIHTVIEKLGLNDEQLPQAPFSTASELHRQRGQYYHREDILPRTQPGSGPGGQVIFSSTSNHNHLISFAEICAMYLLNWSPALWAEVSLEALNVDEKYRKRQDQELAALQPFVAGLERVRRLMAHIPCYMIFDDHDVTDDWNLTAQWEQRAYEHPFARRILGNALMGYWLFQAWGNDPDNFKGDFWRRAEQYREQPSDASHSAFIEHLYRFERWHYVVDTQPKLVVMDSRTRRWRSESNLNKPSGLMDWEALCELQQTLIGEQAVILVSPAPIFGVKLIEAVQRFATLIGKPLLVDAENWMAHPGAAHALLNMFRHPKTPQNFVILSGDVHYSFVYDVELRFRDTSPRIWQITSSGIKNQFPSGLLSVLDHLNRYLYSIYSPLNLFTKRRGMQVQYREVVGDHSRRLIERSGLGLLALHEDGSVDTVCDLHCDGSRTEFVSHE
ncbi:MAG: alkaline phosphatase D family protein [Pseudomonadales bacterium]